MKKKRLTKEKKLILDLQIQLKEALEDKSYWKGKYESAVETRESEVNSITGQLNRKLNEIEQSRYKVRDENFQLWTLLRLIVVPADKLEELHRIEANTRREF